MRDKTGEEMLMHDICSDFDLVAQLDLLDHLDAALDWLKDYDDIKSYTTVCHYYDIDREDKGDKSCMKSKTYGMDIHLGVACLQEYYLDKIIGPSVKEWVVKAVAEILVDPKYNTGL